MQITLTHCRYTPKWDSLQTIIREATNDESCEITRISRVDNGCDYRAPGEYELDAKRSNNTILPIRLTVVAVGKEQDYFPLAMATTAVVRDSLMADLRSCKADGQSEEDCQRLIQAANALGCCIDWDTLDPDAL